MCIGVVLVAVVVVLVMWLLRCKFLKPTLEVTMQTAFVVVDKYACRNIHGVDKAQTLTDAALGKRGFNLRRDVEIGAAGFSAEG